MKTRWTLAGLVAIGIAMAAGLPAQDTRSQRDELERLFQNAPDQRGVSQPTDVPFSERGERFKPAPLGEKRDFLWDVGGWTRGTLSMFDTAFGYDNTIKDIDLRLWGDVKLYENHRFYARIRSFYAHFDSPTPSDNWQNVRGDQLFYEAGLARMFGWSQTKDLDLTLGRQFFFMGKGLALANVLEGARLYGRSGDWELEALAAQTIRHSPDFDPSLPVAGNYSNRMFFGGTLSTYALLDRKFYAYGLAQMDNNDKTGTLANPASPQAYTYDSMYFGFGGEGNIPLGGLRANELGYSAEAIIQTGNSMANGTATEESISAFAFLADIFWLPGDKLPFPKSRVIFGYGFGSGDPDRGDQNSTVNGNTAGTDDTAFNYFGYANTGYSLGPKLTNLHFFKLNFEGTFIEDAGPWTREFKAGATVYAFFKHHSNEVISDFTAIRPNGWVGTELNLYADWAVTSDLDVGLRYGAFLPGDSYSISKSRQYLSVFMQLAF